MTLLIQQKKRQLQYRAIYITIIQLQNGLTEVHRSMKEEMCFQSTILVVYDFMSVETENY